VYFKRKEAILAKFWPKRCRPAAENFVYGSKNAWWNPKFLNFCCRLSIRNGHIPLKANQILFNDLLKKFWIFTYFSGEEWNFKFSFEIMIFNKNFTHTVLLSKIQRVNFIWELILQVNELERRRRKNLDQKLPISTPLYVIILFLVWNTTRRKNWTHYFFRLLSNLNKEKKIYTANKMG
jgi:hypothetical protein